MTIWTGEIKELKKLYESLKGQSPVLEKELQQLIKADDPNVILLYSRRCLEVIITDLCECELKRPRQTEPLKGIIDKLHKEKKVPSHIITSILSDIALQIASHVNAFLTVPEKQDILKRPTNNQEAYDLIQQAVINHYKALGDPNYDVTDEYYIKNKNLALKAIELDPNYSDAYAWAGLFSVNAGAYAVVKS